MSGVQMQLVDVALAALMVVLGLLALWSRDVLRAVSAFIGFGLLLALVWLRLEAPDLALAEAILGAGFVGGLFLRTAVVLAPVAGARLAGPGRGLMVAAAALGGALIGVFSVRFAESVQFAEGLAERVAAAMPMTGVSHEVTGVLLDFRAFDTLLELCVLLVAALSVRVMPPFPVVARVPGPVVDSFARTALPLLCIVAGFALWRGASAPGGAFQAGALLGAAGIVLGLLRGPQQVLRLGYPLVLTLGVAVFVLVGLAMAVWFDGFLDFPQPLAGALILLIEAAATLAIAAALVLLFTGPMGTREVSGQ